jgi:hypothetical protein
MFLLYSQNETTDAHSDCLWSIPVQCGRGEANKGMMLKKIFSSIVNRLQWLLLLIFAISFNYLNLERLFSSFSQPDADGNGLFTINDIFLHIRESFYSSGDAFTLWLSNTEFGIFFEMDVSNPSLILSTIVSLLLWFMLVQSVCAFILGAPYDS